MKKFISGLKVCSAEWFYFASAYHEKVSQKRQHFLFVSDRLMNLVENCSHLLPSLIWNKKIILRIKTHWYAQCNICFKIWTRKYSNSLCAIKTETSVPIWISRVAIYFVGLEEKLDHFNLLLVHATHTEPKYTQQQCLLNQLTLLWLPAQFPDLVWDGIWSGNSQTELPSQISGSHEDPAFKYMKT